MRSTIWSFAGDSNREKVSTTFLQPFLSYTTRSATSYTLNTETTYDWVHQVWTIPVNAMISQMLGPKKTGLSFPISLQLGLRHYFVTPRDGPKK